MKGLQAAASFLTRVRVGATGAGLSDVGASVPWFPVIGAVVGLVVAAAYAVAQLILPSFLAATLAIGAGIVVTGALHEDGLGDTVDALAGGRDKEDALRILKDPALGTFGVLAVVLTVLARVGALATLGAWTAVAVLPAAHAVSRGAAAALLVLPAAHEGLGSSSAASTTRPRLAAAAVIAVAIGAASSGVWAAPAAVLAGLGTWSVGRVAMGRIGGVTGDVIGAAQQVSETLMLLLAAAFVTIGWPSPAWWR